MTETVTLPASVFEHLETLGVTEKAIKLYGLYWQQAALSDAFSCTLSNESIAELMGTTRQTVQKLKRELESYELIEVCHTPGAPSTVEMSFPDNDDALAVLWAMIADQRMTDIPLQESV